MTRVVPRQVLIYSTGRGAAGREGARGQLFGGPQKVFSVLDYKRYLKEIRRMAKELGWPVREVEEAIWEYDRRTRAGTP